MVDLVHRCLEKDPSHRWPSFTEIAAEIAAAKVEARPGARLAAAAGDPDRGAGRSRLLGVAGAAARRTGRSGAAGRPGGRGLRGAQARRCQRRRAGGAARPPRLRSDPARHRRRRPSVGRDRAAPACIATSSDSGASGSRTCWRALAACGRPATTWRRGVCCARSWTWIRATARRSNCWPRPRPGSPVRRNPEPRRKAGDELAFDAELRGSPPRGPVVPRGPRRARDGPVLGGAAPPGPAPPALDAGRDDRSRRQHQDLRALRRAVHPGGRPPGART